MKVKLLTSMVSDRASYSAGDIIEVSNEVGERLIDRHMAEAVLAPKRSQPAKAIKHKKNKKAEE
jgi:hypothetical protein